jgi:CheY-like chemotaxis protein
VADLRGLKALVVDDHDANRLLVTTLLTSWGCRFVEAADGKAALAMLVQAARDGDPFQVALVDNLMPGLYGPELGRMIKENPEIGDTRLIMMTSLAQRGDAAWLEQIGFSGYLTKPLRQSHLRECLALVMGREGSPAAKAGAPLVTRHTVTESRKRRVRILLAEDNATNQMVSLEILEKLGYRADAVANGQEAIDALQRLSYDLVLMDCEMPELDGFEATRIIRNWKLEAGESKLETGNLKLETGERIATDGGAIEKGGAGLQVSSLKYRASSISIIALTAYAMKGDRERCLESGMNDYL